MVDIVYASSGTAASGGMGSTLIMIVLMIAIFYFLLIRPENAFYLSDSVQILF